MDPDDLQKWVETIDERLQALEAESATEYRSRIYCAYWIYDSMDQIPINTFSERYLMQVIKDMAKELKPTSS